MSPGRVQAAERMRRIAVAAAVFGAFQIHVSLGWFVLGTIAMALVNLRESSGAAAGLGGDRSHPFAWSLLQAAVHLGLVLAPCLCLFFWIEQDQIQVREMPSGFLYQGDYGRGCGARRASLSICGTLHCALLAVILSPMIRWGIRRTGLFG